MEPRPVDVARDAIVIRFSPFSVEGVIKSVRRYSRHYMDPDAPHAPPVYRLSVFAAAHLPGEGDLQLRERLLRAADLSHIDLENNQVMTVGVAAALLDMGFTFWKDGYHGEVEEHYSVHLGPCEPTPQAAERFLSAFPTREATRP